MNKPLIMFKENPAPEKVSITIDNLTVVLTKSENPNRYIIQYCLDENQAYVILPLLAESFRIQEIVEELNKILLRGQNPQ